MPAPHDPTESNHWLSDAPNGCFLSIRVVPRAAKDQIQGLQGSDLKIRLKAPPVDGKANDRLIKVLSDWLNIPMNQLQIARGHTGRSKVVFVAGLEAEQIKSLLLE